MDAIAGLLDGPRAREAFLLRSSLDPPWSLRIRDEAPLTVLSHGPRRRRGSLPDGEDPVALRAGDVAVFRGPEPYTVADDPATAPQVAIEPGQECRMLVPGAEKLLETLQRRRAHWGNAADGATVMLTGTYTLDGEVSGRLLRALPPLLVLREGEWELPGRPAARRRDRQGRARAGGRARPPARPAADRRPARVVRAARGNGSPEWYRAYGDPVVGHALRLLHHNPAHPWTVAELAHETGASRAALARRFTDLVGEPPMAFLTSWRIALAADLLLEPGATIGSVAERVGYGSPFALSTAFKRAARGQPAGAPAGGARGRGRRGRDPPHRLARARRGRALPSHV